ncbi:MAG: hypothetical protein ACO3DQ_01400 [Cephaloticoccus sp.]
MRFAGNAPVAWWRVAWPPAWPTIRLAQSAQFYGQSRAAINAGDYAAAYRILAAARIRDPDNYDAALLMGQISMFQGSYAYADDLFAELMGKHPAQAEKTALTFHDALLCLNRMDRLAEHSLAMVGRDKPHSAVWVRSLMLALQLPDVARTLATRDAGALEQLPGFARLLVEARIDLTMGRKDKARSQLAEVFRGPWNLQYISLHLALLREARDLPAAKRLLGHYSAALGPRETLAQQYLIDQTEADLSAALADFESLVRTAETAAEIDRLQLLLLQEPDAECFGRLHDRLMSRSNLRSGVDGATMWVTGMVCGAPDSAALWKAPDALLRGQDYPAIRAFDFSSTRMADPRSVVRLVNTVSLPREVIWTLLARLNAARD